MDKEERQNPVSVDCPICGQVFPQCTIETHVNRCIFLNGSNDDVDANAKKEGKRPFSVLDGFSRASPTDSKKHKSSITSTMKSPTTIKSGHTKPLFGLSAPRQKNHEEPSKNATSDDGCNVQKKVDEQRSVPLAEKMRPREFEDYVGQSHIMGKDAILRKILDKNETPSMILWGPPGVGKTTLAGIIANRCKAMQNARFVKLSATMVGVNEVKQAVEVAKNDRKFNRKTILFMDEIHRFNKMQQDIFLPHVESGTITLIGATTENPSFSLNSALLSRCRVIVLEKLNNENMFHILARSLKHFEAILLDPTYPEPSLDALGFVPKIIVEESSLRWLAEIADGDARIALNSLQLAMESVSGEGRCDEQSSLKSLTLDSIKDGIKRSHMLYDRKGDQHYDMISALHKSIRASDDNASLYWCMRMLLGGEDPRYVCRRLVRAASEDIGLADPQAIQIALSALDAVQLIGMPEADCIIGQAAVYLARAPKSREMNDAVSRCKRDIQEYKGAQPGVPLHLRNAPTKLMKELNYGKGYNMTHKDVSGLNYMPEGMEDRAYF